jgi:hypothetical protein
MPLVPRDDNDEREPKGRGRRSAPPGREVKDHKHRESNNGNPSPEEHNKICSRDGLPHIRHRPTG